MRSLRQPTQRINLYRGRSGMGGRPPLQAPVFIWAATIGVLLIGAAYGYLQLQISDLGAEKAQFDRQLKGYQEQLAKLQAQKPPTQPDEALVMQTTRLQATERQLSEAIRLIRQSQLAGRDGFAPILRGLARHPVDGLWLNEIQASADGAQFVLRGQTQQPVLVPRLLRALAAEPVFHGRTFGQVQFERRGEADDPLNFELRTRLGEADEG